MKKILSHKLLIIGSLAVVVALLFGFWRFNHPGQIYKVELRSDGFYPNQLIVNRGDTVVFSTTTSHQFWPASNLHPTHDIYSEFDPKKPIAPDASWSFKFTKVGRWKFHDHLLPSFRGEIVVEDAVRSDANLDCQSNKACWEEQLTQTIHNQGLSPAFELVEKLYIDQPEFAADCHGYMHLLGEAAYREFSTVERVILPKSATACAYGFYHGFMENLVRFSADVPAAYAFCQSQTTTKSQWSCYHGIGHGSVEEIGMIGKISAQAYIQPGLDTCLKISTDDRVRDLCASGVFNALAIALNSGKIEPDKIDPYAICALQKGTYFQRPCYGEMNTFVLSISNFDLSTAVRFTRAIPNPTYTNLAMQGLASYHASLVALETDHSETVTICRGLDASLRLTCIREFARGLEEFGPPGREYEPALAFCGGADLTMEEKTTCFEGVLSSLSFMYGQEKVESICSLAPGNYRKYCG